MRSLITALLVVLLLCLSMHGQSIDSGSTGADGAFNPPSQVPPDTDVQGNCAAAPGCTVTVPLREPPEHVFHFTTVTVGQFVTVKFRRNAAYTPVFILAQGDVRINGTIDVSGQGGVRGFTAAQGGPGGSSGGLGGVPGTLRGSGGAGSGPGGGVGGGEDFFGVTSRGRGGSFAGGDASLVYGIPELQPLVGGSGGGGGQSSSSPGGNGGGGGGALLIASSTVIDLGSGSGNAIVANGGAGENLPNFFEGGGGSGGAIRLVSTAIRGGRDLVALGGPAPLGGGPGRIRLESARVPEYTGRSNPQAVFREPGEPIVLFPTPAPAVRVVSIAGIALPAQPTFDVGTPDITLPVNFTNPVSVALEAVNVPSGTRARVLVTPQYGSGARIFTPEVALTGPAGQPKRATVSVNLPARGAGIISAVIDSVVPEP